MSVNQLYEFDPEDAWRFAREIRVSKVKHRGVELVFSLCPYCGGGKSHDTETFAINLETGQFNCKRSSCAMTGNMITLARDFHFHLSDDVVRYLNKDRYGGKAFRRFKRRKIETKDAAVEYFKGRGISEEVCRKYEITTKSGDDTVLCFPFKDATGNLTFIKYRNTDPEKIKNGSKEFCERNCKPILFGMNHCNLENKTLVITEGQVDSLSVTEAGIENAVSVPLGCKGFTWVPYCVDWLENFEKIIVFGDYENGEITLLADIKQRFHRSKQIYHVDERDYKDCKDANDILQKYGPEQVRACIENAVPIPVNHIKALSDVQMMDSDDVERVMTGIYSLDYLLDGGLPVGMVTMINGRTGEGKSTLANQMAIYAKNCGRKVLIYSGELSDSFLKSQIMLQIAGPDFVEEYESVYGKKRARVKPAVRNRINAWLSDMYVYDSSITYDGDEQEELIKVIVNAIQQYGVDYVVVDNLMTAIDLESSEETNKYNRQGDFTNKLTRIALEYKVVIVLVAHRRKSMGDSQNENDEVLGSSQVTNLVGVNVFYGRASDKEIERKLRAQIRHEGIIAEAQIKKELNRRWHDAKKEAEVQRLIKVTKNRLSGECNMSGITAEYDPDSKRIYVDGRHSNLNDSFGWARAEDIINAGFEDVGDYDIIPF